MHVVVDKAQLVIALWGRSFIQLRVVIRRIRILFSIR